MAAIADLKSTVAPIGRSYEGRMKDANLGLHPGYNQVA
jgi:hypothetical protein